MRIDYNYEKLMLQADPSGFIEIVKAGGSPYYILTQGLGYESLRLDYKSFFIDNKILEENYIPVENFNNIGFRDSEKKFVNFNMILKSKKYDYFIHIDDEMFLTKRHWNEHDDEIEEDDDKISKVCNVYYKVQDVKESTLCQEELNKFVFHKEDNSARVSLVIKTQSGFNFKKHKIKPLDVDIDTMYNDSFKPVHEHVVDSLTNTDKGIIMFHGSPGTGKTNYIKHLTTLVKKKNFIFIPVSIIPHLTDPSFIENLVENKGSVLVLEDCENYLQDRNTSANGDVVSIILNLSDGILSDIIGVQIICTFNSKITKIDDALLRKGRLIDDYYFDELEIDKAQALIDKQNIEHNVTKKMSLASIFNLQDNSHRSEPKRTRIGF